MGVYGHDGPDTIVICISVHGEALWAEMGQLGGVGLPHNGPTIMHNDVLPRLRNYALRQSFNR